MSQLPLSQSASFPSTLSYRERSRMAKEDAVEYKRHVLSFLHVLHLLQMSCSCRNHQRPRIRDAAAISLGRLQPKHLLIE